VGSVRDGSGFIFYIAYNEGELSPDPEGRAGGEEEQTLN